MTYALQIIISNSEEMTPLYFKELKEDRPVLAWEIGEAKEFSSISRAVDFNMDYLNGDFDLYEIK